jgi:hypothetical protein
VLPLPFSSPPFAYPGLAARQAAAILMAIWAPIWHPSPYPQPMASLPPATAPMSAGASRQASASSSPALPLAVGGSSAAAIQSQPAQPPSSEAPTLIASAPDLTSSAAPSAAPADRSEPSRGRAGAGMEARGYRAAGAASASAAAPAAPATAAAAPVAAAAAAGAAQEAPTTQRAQGATRSQPPDLHWLAPADRTAVSLYVVNSSSHAMRKLYISSITSSDWHADMLGNSSIQPGQSLTLDVNRPTDQCLINVKAVLDDGRIITTKLDACSTMRWRLSN